MIANCSLLNLTVIIIVDIDEMVSYIINLARRRYHAAESNALAIRYHMEANLSAGHLSKQVIPEAIIFVTNIDKTRVGKIYKKH